MKHSGTQAIETPRLLLRRFVHEDCSDMMKNWIANPKVQFEYGEPIYTTHLQIDDLLSEWCNNYKKSDFYRWAIIEKEHNENIGQIAFCKLEAYHRVENSKSGRVLEKSAMHITDNVQRFIRENTLPEGKVCYCITK